MDLGLRVEGVESRVWGVGCGVPEGHRRGEVQEDVNHGSGHVREVVEAECLRGGLVCKAHTLVYHSLRVIKSHRELVRRLVEC